MPVNTGPDINTYEIPEVSLSNTFNAWRDVSNLSSYKLNKLKVYSGLSTSNIGLSTTVEGIISATLTPDIPTGHTFSGGIRGTTASFTNSLTVVGGFSLAGGATISGDLAVQGGDITTGATTASLFNTTATTLNIGSAAILVNVGIEGAGSVTNIKSATVNFSGNIVVGGTATSFNTTNLFVEDTVITLGVCGGIGLTGEVTKDRGVEFHWYASGPTADLGFFGFDRSTQNFIYYSGGVTSASGIYQGTTGTFQGNYLGGRATFDNLSVTGATVSDKLNVVGAALFSSTSNHVGLARFGGGATFSGGGVTLESTSPLGVQGLARFGGGATFAGGGVTLESTSPLNVQGLARFGGGATFAGGGVTLESTSPLNVQGLARFGGGATFAGGDVILESTSPLNVLGVSNYTGLGTFLGGITASSVTTNTFSVNRMNLGSGSTGGIVMNVKGKTKYTPGNTFGTPDATYANNFREYRDLLNIQLSDGITYGMLVLELPGEPNYTFVELYLSGYNYTNGAHWESVISGYSRVEATNGWANNGSSSVQSSGEVPFNTVRFGQKAAAPGSRLILLGVTGDQSTLWSYANISIDRLKLSFASADLVAWERGITASFLGYQNTTSLGLSGGLLVVPWEGLNGYSGGNYGLGTVTPTARLEVAGTLKSTSLTTGGITATNLNVGVNTAIGIGTGTPFAALDVNGPTVTKNAYMNHYTDLVARSVSSGTDSVGQTGACQIILPYGLTATDGQGSSTGILGSDTMLRIKIMGHQYQNTASTFGASWEVIIHAYFASNYRFWHPNDAKSVVEIKGNAPFSRVRLANKNHNSTTHPAKAVILLGDDTTTWKDGDVATHIQVTDVWTHYTGNTVNWADNWAIDADFALQSYIDANYAPLMTVTPKIYQYMDMAGNLGIGTTGPTARLEVAGTLKSTSLTTGGITATSLNVLGVLGKVGIGTSSPQGKLEVSNGAIYVNNGNIDNTYGDQIFFGAAPANYGTTYLHKIKTSHSVTLAHSLMTFSLDNAASTFVDVLTLVGSGNVGIGTAAPATRLHVLGVQNYGGAANSGILTVGNANNSRQINLGVSDTNSVVYIEGWVPGVGGSHLVLQPTIGGGSVGIGITAPSVALDVVGGIKASTTLNVGGLGTFVGGITASGITATNLNVSNTTTLKDLFVSGNLTFGGTAATINVQSTNVNVADTIIVLGSSGGVGITGDVTNDRGVAFFWNEQANSPGSCLGFFGFDRSTENFVFYTRGASTGAGSVGGVTGTFEGNFLGGGVTATSLAVVGKQINALFGICASNSSVFGGTLDFKAGTVGNLTNIQFSSAVSAHTTIKNVQGQGILFLGANNEYQLSISSQYKGIGIGTAAPGASLDVWGSVKSTSLNVQDLATVNRMILGSGSTGGIVMNVKGKTKYTPGNTFGQAASYTNNFREYRDLLYIHPHYGTTYGMLVLELPGEPNEAFINLYLSGYNYINGTHWETVISGFSHKDFSNGWANNNSSSVHSRGKVPFNTVRLGQKAAASGSGSRLILLGVTGDQSTLWHYADISIDRLKLSYASADHVAWERGITASFVQYENTTPLGLSGGLLTAPWVGINGYSAGNYGIGTTGPTVALDVVGAIKASSWADGQMTPAVYVEATLPSDAATNNIYPVGTVWYITG